MPQQERTQLLAGRAHVPHCRQSGTYQVTHCFMRCIRHPDRGQQSATMQHRQAGGVTRVVLLPISRFCVGSSRVRYRHAVFPQPGERCGEHHSRKDRLQQHNFNVPSAGLTLNA